MLNFLRSIKKIRCFSTSSLNISELSPSQIGTSLKVRGWIRSVRSMKSMSFIELNDGSTTHNLQLISSSPELVKGLLTGCSIEVQGTLKEGTGQKTGQSIELEVQDLTLLGGIDSTTYPLQKKSTSLEFLREHSHLRPRTATFGSILRTRSRLKTHLYSILSDQGSFLIDTPILTSTDAEGAGESFSIQQPFFGSSPAYLTVSAQLQLEAFALSLGHVHTFSPCFRAENSHTSRHLAEFHMLEAEWIAKAHLSEEYLQELCSVTQSLIQEVIKRVCSDEPLLDDLLVIKRSYEYRSGIKKKSAQSNRQQILERLFSFSDTPSIPYPTISYSEAIDKLSLSWGTSLSSEHEKELLTKVTSNQLPLFIHSFPAQGKPFYMSTSSASRGKTVQAVDLLVPGVGELVGGSVRETNPEALVARAKDCGILDLDSSSSPYSWYHDLRVHGSIPHMGFGLGFERLIQWIAQVPNIRDTIPMPRVQGSLKY